MSETTIERAITIHRDEDGHYPLTAVVTDAPGSMPIALVGGMPGVQIYMKWPEWEEIRDHIEHCSAMWPAADDVYEVCNAMPGLVPYKALPCILDTRHGEIGGDPREPIGTPHHFDRLGRSW